MTIDGRRLTAANVRYSHQAEALDFIFRRETGDIPPEMSLWRIIQDADSDADQELYVKCRHIVSSD